MTRKQLMRIASAALGGLAVGLAFMAALLVLNSGGGLVGCTAATAAGWTIPLLAGLVVGGVAWILLAEDKGGGSTPNGSTLSARCAGCGRPVADEWRLCPYCGVVTGVDDADPIAVSSPKREPSL